jgi:membrane-bound metal-dependent hydrolase YbcI (DUF457 family)
MTGKTHFVIGANVAWVAYLIVPKDMWFLLLPLIGGISALLPDLDNRHATVHQWTKGLLRLLLIDRVRHRSLFHSLIIIPLVMLGSAFLLPIHVTVPLVFTLGYMSHPFIDGFNPQGCEFLYPSKKNYRFLPRFLCVDTGGWVDHMLFGLGLLCLAFYYVYFFELINISLVLS